jgi:uncharacterized membrane protein YphA (DoxX/SURF4 family)
MFKKYIGLILRIGLAAVLIFGGIFKLFIAEKTALLGMFTNQQTGYLSSYFMNFISSPGSFIQLVGWFQLALGILILLGLFTQLFAVLSGVLSWIAIVLSPILPAEIRMQKYVAFSVACFALAYIGGGPYSLDSLWWNSSRLKAIPLFRLILGHVLLIAGVWFYPFLPFAKVWNFLLLIAFIAVPLIVMFTKAGLDQVFKDFPNRLNKDVVGFVLRLALAFPFLATAIFFVSFNQFPDMPQLLLLFIAVFLILGLFTRLFALMSVVVLLIQIFRFGYAAGADFALLAVAIALILMGSGRYNIVNKVRD